MIAGGVVAGVLVLFGIIAVVAIAVSGDNDDDTARRGSSDRTPATSGPGGTSGPPTSGTTSLPEQDVYEVGETAHTGDLDVTVTKVEDPFPPEEFVTIDPGRRHVGIEMIIVNTGDDAQTVSTFVSMELTDEQGQRGAVTFAGTDRPQIDGEVPPGETRRGWVVFEVGEQATDLKLRVKGNFTATGSLFKLSS